jgi:ABC-type polysaccharide/polyol phosphate export permease
VVVSTLANLVAYLVSLPILIAVCAAYGSYPSAALLWLPLVLLIEEMLIVGCCLVIASLNVIYRDVQHVVGVLLTLLFYLTPVFYRGDAAAEAYRLAFTLSPIAVLVDAHRSIFLHGAAPAAGPLVLAAAMSGLLCAFGWAAYRRVRHDIVDAI